MSAWLCSEEHINLLANASDKPRKEVFDMLVEENLRSLKARYPGRDFLEEWINDAKEFKYEKSEPSDIVYVALSGRKIDFGKMRERVVATQILKACDCYDYQACETDDYDASKASAYIDAIRKKYTASGESKGKLYDAMIWGI